MAKTRADLLAQCKRRYEEVDGFTLQSLTDWEISNLQGRWWSVSGKDDEALYARMRNELLGYCLVEEDGNGGFKRMFKDSEFAILRDVIDPQLADTLYQAARKHCRLVETETNDLEKKSEQADES